ncbi:class I lanthipeptide [Chitinophaga qingshengii]|uniref:Class I lanthipeptide n=1 Tax=Chitinophaga qingshengii TaxID=1569794 RepID=A0ABR7TNI3_9BACT|nr:class I lanthipeptide [Chitinophaga qingshengii]MBC9932042.1 class I lanthipeptide [Chitinophaga qingshengii]
MLPEKLSLEKKLFLQKETIAVMTDTDVVDAPQAVSAPFRTALSMDTPLRCWPCCAQPNTQSGCPN